MRYVLKIAYDGTEYAGWQCQKNAVSVQEKLESALQLALGTCVRVTASGRTDAGVHADMFCCTLDTESPLRGNKLLSALNFHLPADIAVYGVQEVADTFHPRYAAKGKRYIYRIWNGAQRHPVYSRYAVHRNRPLDVQQLNEAAQAYVGTHDFAAFCAAGSDVVDTVRTVHRCTVERQGDLVLFTVAGDGFLYNMVRIMVGTLLEIADGRLSADGIPAVLDSRDRNHAGPTAPAKGLCLQQVFYDTL